MAHDKDINYVIMLPSNISWIKGLLYFLDSVLLGQRWNSISPWIQGHKD
jgi:hypothetical protein